MKGVHPDAEVLPEMTEEEYGRLTDSIQEDGLLEPIIVHEGRVLDGRHRDRICEELGVKPRYADWDPSCGLSPLEWVIAKNLHRRQLSKAQCAALAVELKPRLADDARKRMLRGKTDPRDSSPKGGARDIAGTTFGVSGRSVSRLEEVRRQSEDVFENVKAGKKTIAEARKTVGLRGTRDRIPPKGAKALRDALGPLHSYLKNWNEDRLYGVTPREAKRLLKVVQEVDQGLFEAERALEERTVLSRALR